jgi:hypothetical protein
VEPDGERLVAYLETEDTVWATRRCGLSGAGVTMAAPWKVATAPTRPGATVAVRTAIGPPMHWLGRFMPEEDSYAPPG